MRRAAYIALVTASIVAAAVALIAAYVASPIGLNHLASIVETRIAREIGGEVEIGSLTGNLTERIELKNVRLVDDGADWAFVKRVAMAWSPAALVSRRLEISSVLIEDASLLASPPARKQRKPFSGFELPDRLPAITINRIELRNLEVSEQLVGSPLRLDGEGKIELGGAQVSIFAALKGADDRDNVEVIISRTSPGVAPTLKINVTSKPDGVISALSKSGGAVTFIARGSGEPANYQIAIDAEAGAYGALSAGLSSNIESLETIDFKASASPGVRFDRWRLDLGDQIQTSGALFPAEKGGRLELTEFSAAFGIVSGRADWTNKDRALDAAAFDLRAEFSSSWRPDVQRAIGTHVEAGATIKKNGRDYSGEASATSPEVSATLLAVKSDLRSTVSGKLAASLNETSALASQLKTSVRGAGDFEFKFGEAVKVSDLSLTTDSGMTFNGDAVRGLDEDDFEVVGDITISATAIRGLIPATKPRGSATGRIDVRGPTNDFDLKLLLSTTPFELWSATWPASAISVSLSNLPGSPLGEVSLRSADGAMESSAQVRKNAEGAISIAQIDHHGANFALSGDASFNPVTRAAVIDLRYAGADGAEPWPGVELSGAASAKGAFSRTSLNNRFEVDVSSLRARTLSLETATLRASGPADRMTFEVSAAELNMSDRVRLERPIVAGVANLGEQASFRIASASADFMGAPAMLNRPLEISAGDGVKIDQLSMSIGDNGAIDINGAFDARRWRAEAAVRNLQISANGGMLDIDLALDTEKPVAAAGDFSIRSGRLEPNNGALNGNYAWDGRRLSVVAGGGASALGLNLDLPLALRRAGRLHVSMEGALRGSARFNGRAETIALFLPLSLQSLEGDLAFSGTLGGTTKDPRVSGELSMTDGAFTEANSGLSIVDIDLTSVAAASSAATTLTFRGAAAGPGQSAQTISAEGVIDIKGGASLSANISLDGARFAAGPVERVEATGSLNVAGPFDDLLISGDVVLDALEAKLFAPENLGLVDIEVIPVGADGKPFEQKATGRQRRGGFRYAVRISADDDIVVSGRGLDSEWRANAQLSGTSERPLFLGTMNLNRGDLEFSGRRFDLTRGSIGFDTLAPNDPTIDLRAERETREGDTVAVVITGRSSALKVALESVPARPSEDVMALILFDKPANELSAFQSLQVADALTQIGGVGVFGGKGVAGAARDALGLDLLNLDVDQTDSSASLLTVGKYVTDGLFVSASQNARGENGSLRIEYEIGQSFSVETELRQDGDQTVSANWKKDF